MDTQISYSSICLLTPECWINSPKRNSRSWKGIMPSIWSKRDTLIVYAVFCNALMAALPLCLKFETHQMIQPGATLNIKTDFLSKGRNTAQIKYKYSLQWTFLRHWMLLTAIMWDTAPDVVSVKMLRVSRWLPGHLHPKRCLQLALRGCQGRFDLQCWA